MFGRAGADKVDVSTTIGSVELSSPIMTAAGTAGHGAELSAYFDLSSLGAVVVKSLAPYPWDGNPPVRVHQTPSGMINSVGLQGPGIEGWLADELPDLEAAGATVIASIWGGTVDDYRRAAEMLADAPANVVAVEVNISCPNTEHGNELFAHSCALTGKVIAATEACGRPRWAKLSPNVGPTLPDIAAAAHGAGAEAVTVHRSEATSKAIVHVRTGGLKIRNPKSEIETGWVGEIPNSEFRIPNSIVWWNNLPLTVFLSCGTATDRDRRSGRGETSPTSRSCRCCAPGT